MSITKINSNFEILKRPRYFLVFLQIFFLFIAAYGYEVYKIYFILIEVLFLLTNIATIRLHKYILFFFYLLALFYPYSISTLIFSFFSYLFAIRLVDLNISILSKIVKVVLVVQIIYILNQAFTGINPNEFISASRNHIGVPFIFLGSLSLFLDKKKNVLPNKILYAFISLICLWSVSRSNIISGFLLFILSFFLKNPTRVTKLKKFTSFSLILVFVTLIIFNLDIIKSKLFEKSFTLIKFLDDRNSILENERLGILDFYIDSLNGFNYLVGKNIDYNIHNSYFNLHALYGIIGITFFIYIFFKINKNIIFLIPVLLRSFTDTVSFFSAELDFLFFYLAIFTNDNKK